jgi:hypothetical protein
LRFFLGPALLLIVFSVCACQSSSVERGSDGAYFLPTGSAEAGQRAFLDLKCSACHAVVGRDDLPAAKAADPGPALGSLQARQSRGDLATAIIAPSHSLALPGGIWADGELSRMGDYSEVMTIRQLIDLVAFLKSLESP